MKNKYNKLLWLEIQKNINFTRLLNFVLIDQMFDDGYVDEVVGIDMIDDGMMRYE